MTNRWICSRWFTQVPERPGPNRLPASQCRTIVSVIPNVAMSVLVVLSVATVAEESVERRSENRAALREAIRHESITRTEPRPLRIQVLRYDLHAPGFELAVAIGEDPDGDGPIEAVLTHPRALARDAGLVAAVNTNPWRMIPPTTDGIRTPYVAGLGCDISGWAVSDGNEQSPPQDGHGNVWVDEAGRVRVDQRPEIRKVRQAAAGFGGLIHRGEMVAASGQDLHPRTAVGIDRQHRWLTLVVVDGRQAEISEGMSLRELADLMAELGCHDAINLDGGGSSIMLLQDDEGHLRLQNRPSDRTGPRPIPVMLGIRRQDEQNN
jgi:hypothetical protein